MRGQRRDNPLDPLPRERRPRSPVTARAGLERAAECVFLTAAGCCCCCHRCRDRADKKFPLSPSPRKPVTPPLPPVSAVCPSSRTSGRIVPYLRGGEERRRTSVPWPVRWCGGAPPLPRGGEPGPQSAARAGAGPTLQRAVALEGGAAPVFRPRAAAVRSKLSRWQLEQAVVGETRHRQTSREVRWSFRRVSR